MTDYTYDEKRNFARMSIETQVTYTVKNSKDSPYHGTSTDLSATGLAMTTDHELTVGDEIEIVMNASSERLPPFVADGSVLRVESNDDNTFDVSISLTVKES
jgi:c-di-GMP-binding flagellar brake protein YcgR